MRCTMQRDEFYIGFDITVNTVAPISTSADIRINISQCIDELASRLLSHGPFTCAGGSADGRHALTPSSWSRGICIGRGWIGGDGRDKRLVSTANFLLRVRVNRGPENDRVSGLLQS